MPVIDDIYLRGFAYPCLLVPQEGHPEITGAALFAPPPMSETESQIAFYSELPPGWHVCPLGYAVFVVELEGEPAARIAIYGLKIHGLSTAHGKLGGLTIKSGRSDIEHYARKNLSAMGDVQSRLQAIVSSGVHEFRSINKTLYHLAYRLENILEQEGHVQSVVAKSIVELSEMIKSRSDIFDVITNPEIAKIVDQKVHVYRAFDRARKSLVSTSPGRIIRIQGNSQGRAKAVQMFDVVPYILLENAVKYAPPDSEIIIDVQENSQKIYTLIESLGPSLRSGEEERIFMPGFRGQYAAEYESQGSGMGLFVVKRLVEYCEGASISLVQTGDQHIIQGIPFHRTSISVQLLRAE